jgi:hypothetical protein
VFEIPADEISEANPSRTAVAVDQVQLVGRYSRKDPRANATRVGENASVLIDGLALPSLPTALNNAMYLIRELTNNAVMTIEGLKFSGDW